MIFNWRRSAPKPPPPERPQGGERERRLRRLFDETHDIAWRVLRRSGTRTDRIEDCFQQVFLVASNRLDDIRPGSERAFIYGIALRVSRASGREGWRETPDEGLDLRASSEPNAEHLLERRRLIELCDRILAQLTPDLREAFVLFEIEGMSGIEVARLLEIPEGTAHSRLRRARHRVRALLDESSEETGELRHG